MTSLIHRYLREIKLCIMGEGTRYDLQHTVVITCAIYSLLFLDLAPKNPKTHLSGYEFAKKCFHHRWFGHFYWEVSLFLARWHQNQCVQQVGCCAIYHSVLVTFQVYCYMPRIDGSSTTNGAILSGLAVCQLSYTQLRYKERSENWIYQALYELVAGLVFHDGYQVLVVTQSQRPLCIFDCSCMSRTPPLHPSKSNLIGKAICPPTPALPNLPQQRSDLRKTSVLHRKCGNSTSTVESNVTKLGRATSV